MTFNRFPLAQASSRNGAAAAGAFSQRRFQIALLLLPLGARLARIELDEKVSGLDAAAILDGDPDDPARIERLHHLGASARLDAALGHGVNLKPAEIGPGERSRKKEANQPDHGDPYGRWRRFKKFEGRGQEFAIHPVHATRRDGGRFASAARAAGHSKGNAFDPWHGPYPAFSDCIRQSLE